MTDIYIVTPGNFGKFIAAQYAFSNLEEAKKCKDFIDRQKGGSSLQSTIHILTVFDKFENEKIND